MEKHSLTEILLYLITGLIPLVGYYLLMSEYFRVSPFEGYYLIITIYLVICYLLYPVAGIKLSEATSDKKFAGLISAKTQLLFAFIFAPFIVIFNRKNNI